MVNPSLHPRHCTKNKSVKCYKQSQLLLYYRLLFLLLFHNPEDTEVGHSVAPHIPEGSGRAHLGTGLHLDKWIPLHPHQSFVDIDAPRKKH